MSKSTTVGVTGRSLARLGGLPDSQIRPTPGRVDVPQVEDLLHFRKLTGGTVRTYGGYRYHRKPPSYGGWGMGGGGGWKPKRKSFGGPKWSGGGGRWKGGGAKKYGGGGGGGGWTGGGAKKYGGGGRKGGRAKSKW